MVHQVKFDNVEQKLAHLNSLMTIPSINPKAYDENEGYLKMDFIDHPEYGVGFIEEIVSNYQVRAFFPVGEKMLVQKKYIKENLN